jgi:hypothetical protein
LISAHKFFKENLQDDSSASAIFSYGAKKFTMSAYFNPDLAKFVEPAINAFDED